MRDTVRGARIHRPGVHVLVPAADVAYGVPIPIASDNNGNAWVANAFTTDPNSYPTAIYIQNSDHQACSADPSTFSTSSTPKVWATWAAPGDACIKQTLDFHALINDGSMLGKTITGLALDASMDPWFVLVDGASASRSAPNVVILHYSASAGTLTKWVSATRKQLHASQSACLPA
jgi:hypothetical protein